MHLMRKKYGLVLLVICILTVICFAGCDNTMKHVTIHTPETKDETDTEKTDQSVTHGNGSSVSTDTKKVDVILSDVIVDMDAYYAEVSTVIQKIPAEKSTDIQNEITAVTDITSRGFDEFPVTSQYDKKGNIEKKEVSDNSFDVHPMYSTIYKNCYGDLWSIMVINGVIEATPISYIYEHNYERVIVFVETDTVMSYDNVTNTFYETIPHDDILTLIKIKRINSKKLDITFQEIDQAIANYDSNKNE